MAAFRNQITGLVRFSYPSLSGFTRADGSLEALRARLYDRTRLERRFHLFEGLTLPSLVAQTDPDFGLIILTGDDLPGWAVDRLQAAIAGLADARVLALPAQHHYPATQRALAGVAAPKATHLTTFRLDDDDALDRDHIARMRRRTAGLARFLDPEQPFVTGSNRGYFLELSAEGNQLYDVAEKLPLGIGLAMTAPVACVDNIFRRNHRLLAQFYNTFTDGETPAFIRTVHDDNDSAPYSSGQTRQMTPRAIVADIMARFPFDVDHLLDL